MAKNTGRGAVRREAQTETTWVKNNTSVGVFAEAKRHGGDFRGLQPRRGAFSRTFRKFRNRSDSRGFLQHLRSG